jgi:hypothetical protein
MTKSWWVLDGRSMYYDNDTKKQEKNLKYSGTFLPVVRVLLTVG